MKRYLRRSGLLGLILVGGAIATGMHRQQPGPAQQILIPTAPVDVQVDQQSRQLMVLQGPGADARTGVALPGGVRMLDARSGVSQGMVALPDTPCEMAIDARHHTAIVTVTRNVPPFGAVAEDVHVIDTDRRERNRGLVLTQTSAAQSRASNGAWAWSYTCRRDHIAIDVSTHHAFVVPAITYHAGGALPPVVGMIDERSGILMRRIALPSAGATIAIAQGTHHAFITAASGAAVWMLDTRTGALLKTLHIRSAWNAMSVDDRAQRIFIGTGGGGMSGIVVVDARTGGVRRRLPTGFEPAMIALDASRQRLFLLGERGRPGHPFYQVTTFDLRRNRALRTVDIDPLPVSLTVDTRAGRLYVLTSMSASWQAGCVNVLDTATGALIRTMYTGFRPSGLAIAPDERHIYVSAEAASSSSLPLIGLWPFSSNGQPPGVISVLNPEE